jgi:ribose 5-phosphate isomerase B
MRIAVGSDHRGFAAKQRIREMLTSQGIEVIDFGTHSAESCDYPDAAIRTATSISRGEADCGILCCGTGIGMSITANKARGVRASLCHDEITAEMSRRHNNANVLCLPADFLHEDVIDRVVEIWLRTQFEGGRHERRVQKISSFENSNGHSE